VIVILREKFSGRAWLVGLDHNLPRFTSHDSGFWYEAIRSGLEVCATRNKMQPALICNRDQCLVFR